jgi:hypothetical protein
VLGGVVRKGISVIKRISLLIAAAFFVVALSAPAALAAPPEADPCTKYRGTVTCTEGPGNNQGGVGETTEGQGNIDNTSPQDNGGNSGKVYKDECNPPSSQGKPCNP